MMQWKEALKNGRLNSHKIASNQCEVQTRNEKKLLIPCFTANFSEILCHLQGLRMVD